MSNASETFEFQTEARQLLDLMIHSIYSNKEIFLRELISNSSDALDKRRFEAVRAPELLPDGADLHIRIVPDKAARTVSVIDNGIGMSRQEVIDLIGTIAKSGTQEFLKVLKASKEPNAPAALIGQFGVGFYSCFMVAEKVELLTRRAGEDSATRWESAGLGTYTIEPAQRDEPGTSVTVHLKPADSEDGLEDFTAEWIIRRIVKHYSDFVAYPIRMDIERTKSDEDADGKPVPGSERTVIETETLNSMKAIWLRDREEVTDEEHGEFYKHISHDWNEPLARIQAKIEGTLEYRLLLYIPSRMPFDVHMISAPHHGVHLYVKRVFIMDDCRELLPPYLRFLRGVVDSEDLSLNISREMLQKDRQIERMRKGIVAKVLDSLKQFREKEPEKYSTFWSEFGAILKEGLFQDHENQAKLLDLCLFQSTADPKELTGLQAYTDRMRPDQKNIYYLTGQTREKAEQAPHLEAYREKGYEVLLLSDPVDEVWTQAVSDFEEKPFQSVMRGEAELGSEEERREAEETRKEREKNHAPLLECLKEKLADRVREVRLSARLTESPACLVGAAGDLSPQLEQMMRAMGHEAPAVKRVLELNPGHPVFAKLQRLFETAKDDPVLGDFAELLYGQALLAEGGTLPNPARFSRLVADVMAKAL